MLLPNSLPASQCIAMSKKGFRCNNAAMLDTQYCRVHNAKYAESVRASSLVAAEAKIAENIKRRSIKVDNFDDLLEVQKRIYESLARKSGTMSAKELSSFVALGNALARGFKEKAFIRIKNLEEKVKHL